MRLPTERGGRMSHKVSELNNLLPGIFDFIDPDEVVSDAEFESMKAELEKYLEVLKRKLKEKK